MLPILHTDPNIRSPFLLRQSAQTPMPVEVPGIRLSSMLIKTELPGPPNTSTKDRQH